MVAYADIVVQSRDHKPQLVVETKNKIPASADWAARMRRNLFAHMAFPPARFFLLALPERFYLWKDASPAAVVPPDYEIDARQVLKPYLDTLHTPIADLSEDSFQLLVQTWLEDLVGSSAAQLSQADDWLKNSGLYDAIKYGTVKTQALS